MKLKLLLIFTCIFFLSNIKAQDNLSGTWNGTLTVAGQLRLVLHITQLQDGTYSGKLDSPDQNVSGIICDSVSVKPGGSGSMLTFTINKLKVSYTGTLVDDSTLSGTFTQGVNIPLDFHRTDIPFTARVINRPQTPKPPFPYKSEQVVYSGNGLQYGGTITIPPGNGPFPALVLITGSGQQDRDETIFNHKPFAVLADALTRDGFVVLRVDDRGIGNSTGNFATSTTADFANDVNTSLEYLKSRREVNNDKVGLLGHSEGGMIAPMVASQRKDINFIVLLAAPGVKIIDLMAEQNAAVMRSAGVDSNFSESFRLMYPQLITILGNATDTTTAMQRTLPVLQSWQSKQDTINLHKLGFNTTADLQQYVRETYTVVSMPWFKYFINFDPQQYLTKLKKVKVLALNGSRDIQVVSSQNLPAVRSALISGKTKTFETKELPGLNHLFQTCNKCTVTEYGQLDETIAPIALQTITDWLNQNAK
jgi:uncharacterized protein